MHIPASTFEIVTGTEQDFFLKKRGAATEKKTHMYSLKYTQASARYQACLSPKWKMLEKLNLSFLHTAFW